MLADVLLFAFFALGVKVVLAAVVLYGLLPKGGNCARCDGDTTPVLRGMPARAVYALLRIERRWCPSCGELFTARRGREPRLWVGAPGAAVGPSTPRVGAGRG